MIHDITPEITRGLKVWPGDQPVAYEAGSGEQRADAKSCSVFHGTVHVGAHVDAPSHCRPGGASIGECDLTPYIGLCQVIRMDVGRGAVIAPDSIQTPIIAQRVLFVTGTYPNPAEFNKDFAALSPEAMEALHRRGVVLVGIDTPSVDPFDAVDLPSHKAAGALGIALLEGLVLDGIVEGLYELIALPLRLVGFDASPVRAILRPLEAREQGR